MKKSQKSSHGTAASTRRTRSQSKGTRTTSNTETISKFFKKIDNHDDKHNHNQSIYKDAVTEVGETHPHNSSNISDADGDADFVAPKPAKKLAQIFTQVKEANVKRAIRSKTKRGNSKKEVGSEEKKLMHLGKSSDINVEHLQLAMALSKSMEPELSAVHEDVEENVYPSTQQITENARLELAAYRLPSHGQKKTSQKLNSGENVNPARGRKKSKFRYVKPKLVTTTNEERERIIQEKIAQILSCSLDSCSTQEQVEEVVHSYLIRDNVNENKRVFKLSQQVDRNMDVYYVDALKLDKSEALCGCLLKNWDFIAGRETSPERESNIRDFADVKPIDEPEIQENYSSVNIEAETSTSQQTFVTAKSCSSYFSSVSQTSRKMIRSVSPDLFASDEEMLEEEVFTLSTTQNKEYDNQNTQNSCNTEKTNESQQDKSPKVCFKGNYASASLLSNINAIKEKNKDEVVVVKDSIETSYDCDEDVGLNIDSQEKPEPFVIDFHEKISNNEKFKNFASASLLSNINAKNINSSDVHFNDSDQKFEVDDNGICTYESFCDYDERNFDYPVNSDSSADMNLSIKSPDKTVAVDANKKTNATRNVVEGADVDNNDKDSNLGNDSTANSSFNHSYNSYNNDSYANMNVTHHVQKLLNSETIVNDYKSICVENYFNSTKIDDESPDKSLIEQETDSALNNEVKTHAKEDFIDLSQDKLDSDSDHDDECIDLSQDSDDDNHDKHQINLPSLQRNLSSKSLDSSISTNESICISDEELNYSCLNATPKPDKPEQRMSWKYEKLAYKKNLFAISDSEDDESPDKDNKHDDEQMVESINVTKLLVEIQERKNKDKKNKSVILSLDDDDEDDELQEAMRLSLVEAENDEKRRENISQENKTIQDCEEDDENNEKQDGDASIINQNGDLRVVDEFADSFPSFNDNFDIYQKPINEGSKISSVSMAISNDVVEMNKETVETLPKIDSNVENNFNHSFPSFDHDNFDNYAPNCSIQPSKTIAGDEIDVNKSLSPQNKFDEFDLLVGNDQSLFNRLSNNLKPRRVQELTGAKKTPIQKLNNTTNKRTSVAFEDTFANLLEQTNVLQNLDQIGNQVDNKHIDKEIDARLKTPPAHKTNVINNCPVAPATPADGIFVKTVNVTPMPMYDNMTTPEIHSELDKIGVKRMKRRRGVQMLKHVYNSMHLQLQKQVVTDELGSDKSLEHVNNVEKLDDDLDDLKRPNKRPKKLNYEFQDGGDDVIDVNVQQLLILQSVRGLQSENIGNIEINRKLTECEPLEDLIFERKQSKRIKSCALPFHIAWHNFLCVNRDIWENVLLYEPLQVEVLYAMLKEQGFKYHIQDMITFFDKKCITIRIKQNN